MKKVIISLVAITVIAGVGFVVLNNKDENASTDTSMHDNSEEHHNGEVVEQANNEQSEANELDPNNHTDGANIGQQVDATDQSEVAVSIDDLIFETTYLKIKRGTKVTWTNNGNIRHDVTSANGSPKGGLGSELLGNGDSYEFTFDEVGLYEYFCTPHPSQMRATVVVVD